MEANQLKTELEAEFPEYHFFRRNTIYGKCIVAQKTSLNGAYIFVRKNKVIVAPEVPALKMRMLLGAGVIFLKMFRRDFTEPAQRIMAFLQKKEIRVKMRE